MHGFWRVEPGCQLTASQREIARRILLGCAGEFGLPDDQENTAQDGEKTGCDDAPISLSAHPSRRSENMGLVLLENLPINRVTTFPCAHCLRTVITIRYGSQTELVFDARPTAVGDDIALKAHTCTDDATDGGGL